MTLTDLRILTLGLAIPLTTATQFRISGLPLGPGELLIVAWLGLTAPELLKQSKKPSQHWARYGNGATE